MNIKLGINGFGRIGKCIFLQLVNDMRFEISCVNDPSICIDDIEDYLKHDSVHSAYDKTFQVVKVSDDMLYINNRHMVRIFNERDARKIRWRENHCSYVVEATGMNLTTDKCTLHDVDYVIMSAPPKDNTPTFVYGANHDTYLGQKIISASSCTTNCLAPPSRS